MIMVLNPTYTVRVRFKDAPATALNAQAAMAHFGGTPKLRRFADLENDKTGCDEFIVAVKDALQKAGLGNAEITFEKYEQA